MKKIESDGSIFSFPDGTKVTKLDEWPQYRKGLTDKPFEAKSCDIAAIYDGSLWLIEAKDYTYQDAPIPKGLPEITAIKAFHTLALIYTTAKWEKGVNNTFSLHALKYKETKLCLALELPDGGRKLQALENP